MQRWRRLAFLTLCVIFLGGIGTVGGYAWYLRSDGYRNSCASRLSAQLGLDSSIGRVVPRSWTAQAFEDLTVWLPERRDEAAIVHHAILAYDRTTPDPDDYEIVLKGGLCEVSARTWLREDVRFIVTAGLRPGFAPDGPKRVTFSNFDLRFERAPFMAQLTITSGVVNFPDATHATVTANCRELNGYLAEHPIVLSAAFSPTHAGIEIDELELRVPALPLRIVGLDHVAGLQAEHGDFAGTLSYQEAGPSRCVTLVGECRDLWLEELTAPFLPRPLRGRCPVVRLEDLTLQNRIPERLAFRGRLTELQLGDLLRLWGLADLDAEFELDVRSAVFTRNGIERFVASGRGQRVDLRRLSRTIGRGEMTGIATLTIRDLAIADNRLQSLEARIEVAPADPPNWISRELALEVAGTLLGFSLPPVLPSQVAYTSLGVELKVVDEMLYILGTHGPRDGTILTVKLPVGGELPLIDQPEHPIPLEPWTTPGRARLQAFLDAQLEELRTRFERAPSAAEPAP